MAYLAGWGLACVPDLAPQGRRTTREPWWSFAHEVTLLRTHRYARTRWNHQGLGNCGDWIIVQASHAGIKNALLPCG